MNKIAVLDYFTGELLLEKPYSEWKNYDKNKRKFCSYCVEEYETSMNGETLLVYVNIFED